MNIQIRYQGVPHSKTLEGECERFAAGLEEEFPEISSFDVGVTRAGEEREIQVHVTGRGVDVAAHASSRDTREAVASAFERIHRQLRRRHDRQRSGRRRSAQKDARQAKG